MRSSLLFLTLAVVATAVCVVNAQSAPNPPPIWPESFYARFGLDQASNVPPIVNSTCTFYYNLAPSVFGQLIDYPEYCPVSPNPTGGNQGCQALFLEAGIYVTQPAQGIKCCMLFADVGPTPRNFTRGFTWQGIQQAEDYYGDAHTCDWYTGGDPSAPFGYWTEVGTHHDVQFLDGGDGPYWAWDHLQVVTVPAEVFNLFADPQTCNTPCGTEHFGVDTQRVQQHAAANDPFVKLALHHHKIQKAEQQGSDSFVALE